jgi:ankyrin repeat protein
MSELLEALYRADEARVSELLAADPELDVLEAAAFGRTAPLHSASASENKDQATRYELCELLLDRGADPNLKQGGGFTALDSARQNGDERLERLFIARGARR